MARKRGTGFQAEGRAYVKALGKSVAGTVTHREVVPKMRLERLAGPECWELCGCAKNFVILNTKGGQ